MCADSSGRRTKVERVIERYGLEQWGVRLEAEWLGDGDDRTSLRDLAREFNLAVLETALREAGERPSRGELEEIYEALTDDDSRSLERSGDVLARTASDIRSVRSDFVTHQAIHTYLTTVREAQLPDEDDTETRRDRKKRRSSDWPVGPKSSPSRRSRNSSAQRCSRIERTRWTSRFGSSVGGVRRDRRLPT